MPQVATKNLLGLSGSPIALIGSLKPVGATADHLLSAQTETSSMLQVLFQVVVREPPLIIVRPSREKILITLFDTGPGRVSAENVVMFSPLINPDFLSAIHIFPLSGIACAISGEEKPDPYDDIVLSRVPSVS